MSSLSSPISCEQFETNVSDYVDQTLEPGERAVMDLHLAACDACTTLVAEVGEIVAGAAALPQLSASRDLWSGISERLDTPVVSIGTTGTHAVRNRRGVSYRMFAAAAVLLAAVSSGATYVFTREKAVPPLQAPVASAPVTSGEAATASAPDAIPSAVVPPVATTRPTLPAGEARGAQNAALQTRAANERPRSRYASNDGSVELVYEREITAMRRIVDERLGDLDSVTVVEIERNLRIIDKAISDSRRALQNDPRSRFLSSQLDRALETKLGVLRRIALL